MTVAWLVLQMGCVGHTENWKPGEPSDSGTVTEEGEVRCLLTLRERDDAVDGTVDSVTTFEYDAVGNLLVAESDDGLDGTLNGGTYQTWDERGNQLSREIDYGGNGQYDLRYAWTYDDEDRLLTDVYEDRLNPQFVSVETHSYSYDAAGHVLVDSYESELNGESHVSWEATYTYEDDLLMDLVVTGFGAGTERYTYDAHGWMIAYESDRASNGTIDATGSFEYDADGHLFHEQAFDGDGVLYGEEVWVWDAGNIVMDDAYGYYAGDIVAHEHWDLAYDDAGRKIYESWDDVTSASAGWIEQWAYDEAGHEVHFEHDFYADGTRVATADRTFDARGLERVALLDPEGDRVVTRYTSHYSCDAR